jgi:hypothetical protein
MAGQNDELRRLRPDGLVFGKSQPDRFDALLVPALTDEVKAFLDSLPRLEFRDLLIDLAEENLVTSDPFFAIHDEGLSPLRNLVARIRLGRHSPRLPNLLYGREAVVSGDDLLVHDGHLVPRGDRESPRAGANVLVFAEREADDLRAARVGALTEKRNELDGKRVTKVRGNVFDLLVRAAKGDLIFGHT